MRRFPARLLVVFLLAGCHFETRPPAGIARTQATIQAAVVEHYRARSVLGADTVRYEVQRRQVDVRRDLASVWVTLREHHRVSADSTRDTTRTEHLLLRRSEAGWVVLAATPVSAP